MVLQTPQVAASATQLNGIVNTAKPYLLVRETQPAIINEFLKIFNLNLLPPKTELPTKTPHPKLVAVQETQRLVMGVSLRHSVYVLQLASILQGQFQEYREKVMNPLASAFAAIHETMASACRRAGRKPESVQLLAVSKTQSALAIDQAAAVGQRIFGENRVQEARDKVALVRQPELQWHLIGPLQRNKVKIAVQLFHMIQSVDSLELAREIDRRMPPEQVMPVLLQVNIGGESQKSGMAPQDLEGVLTDIAQLPHLSVRGLMTVPPFTDDAQETRPFFREMAKLAQDMGALNLPGVSMDTLSMGMSHDFAVAIEEGSTLVRIGSLLFGSRQG